MTVDLYLHQGKQFFVRWTKNERVREVARVLGCTAAGFFLSAGGMAGHALPFSMALVSVITGWRVAATGLGSVCGYLFSGAKAVFRGPPG
jgi:hypothetical protein